MMMGKQSAEQERLVRCGRLPSESLNSLDSSEGPEGGDDESQSDEEGGVVHHRRHSSLENFKLTAHSVAELRVYFELLSSRNQSAKAQGEWENVISWICLHHLWLTPNTSFSLLVQSP